MTNIWNFIRWMLDYHDRNAQFRAILEQHEQELYR